MTINALWKFLNQAHTELCLNNLGNNDEVKELSIIPEF